MVCGSRYFGHGLCENWPRCDRSRIRQRDGSGVFCSGVFFAARMRWFAVLRARARWRFLRVVFIQGIFCRFLLKKLERLRGMTWSMHQVLVLHAEVAKAGAAL